MNKIAHGGSLRLGIWVFAGLLNSLLMPVEAAHSQAFEPLVTLAPLTPVKVPEPSRSFAFTPMTGEQRWQDFRKVNLESPGAIFQTFFTGLGDTTGRVPHWDSGAIGFSEHLGSEFARFTIAGAVHSSLAAALHQDTRYFPCNCRGGLHRTLHAISRTLITYDDQGRRRPDISGLAGIYAGPTIMTSWYPDKYTAFGYGVRQANIAVGITTAIYVIREFSPDIKRSLHFGR